MNELSMLGNGGYKQVSITNPKVFYPPSDITTSVGFGEKIVESSDGKILAVGVPRITSGANTSNGAVYLYDAKTLLRKQTLVPPVDQANQLFGLDFAFTKDRSKLYVCASGYKATNTVGRIYVFSKDAGADTYTYTTALTGTTVNGEFGTNVVLAENDSMLFSGARSTNGALTLEGRVEQWNLNTNTRTAVLGVAGAKTRDFLGSSLAYSESLGGVLFAGAIQQTSSTDPGFVHAFSAQGTQLLNDRINLSIKTTSPNVLFGVRSALSPNGHSLAVVATGFRVGNGSGGGVCGAVEIFRLTRSGDVLERNSVGFLEFSDMEQASGQVNVAWIDDNNLLIGHMAVTVSGVPRAGIMMLATRTRNGFTIKDRSTSPALPMPDNQPPVTNSRFLGSSMAVSSVNKRIYAGLPRDLNAQNNPVGRVAYWDYE